MATFVGTIWKGEERIADNVMGFLKGGKDFWYGQLIFTPAQGRTFCPGEFRLELEDGRSGMVQIGEKTWQALPSFFMVPFEGCGPLGKPEVAAARAPRRARAR